VVDPISFSTFLALAAIPASFDEFVGSLPAPIIAISPAPLTGLPSPNIIATIATCPCVFVGLGSEWPGAAEELLDVFATDDAMLGVLTSAVAEAPIASAALAVLLRRAGRRSTAEGLGAESAVYSTLQAGPEFARWRTGYEASPHRAPPNAATGPVVLVDRPEPDVLHITLSRPDVHNAYSAQMRDELTDALHIAVADPSVGRVVIMGAGPSFCSGGDLDEFGSFPDPATAHLIRLQRSAARLLSLIADRVEVRLHGACFGAGIELPAFAHRVVAAPDTVIALPEVALGLIPGAGGTVSLPRRMGRHRTAWLALTGERIDASTARAWGLVDEVATS
jgi:hypothetical protein